MNSVRTQPRIGDVPSCLAELLNIPANQLKVRKGSTARSAEVDLVVSSGDRVWVVNYKASGQAATVAMAARRARGDAETLGRKAIPLVAVPFMGDVGRRMCEEAGVGWLDLSGNAHIVAPGMRVQIEGKPNRFKRVGRPRSLFAPKSARIARWLLMRHREVFTQRELARLSGLDEGSTSRIVRGLSEQQLVSRQADGLVRVTEYGALLDALFEAHDFSMHQVVRGHVASRSSDELLRRLAETLQTEKIEHAATALAGAWQWCGFAGYRLVTMFVAELPDANALGRIGFHETERGENVWLVRPNDSGVFHGSEVRDGISCANPVQVYLDLKDHPERSADAAANLRGKLLNPSPHA